MRFFLVLAAGLILLTTAANAVDADAPRGYQLMCLKQPAQCTSTGPSRASGNAATLETLTRINNTVNRTMQPKPDVGPDRWSTNVSTGDCEDFALAKRAALIKLGFPSASLHIAYGTLKYVGGHAVLVANIKSGTYVLDMPGIEKEVKPISTTPYKHWRTL